MNKGDAQLIVYRLAARSLRNMARRRKDWPNYPEFPKNMTEAQQDKVAKEFVALAEKLEGKVQTTEKPPIEGEKSA